jgi:hypothetical protein
VARRAGRDEAGKGSIGGLGQECFERARTLPAQGSIERRARKRGIARSSFTSALALFVEHMARAKD